MRLAPMAATSPDPSGPRSPTGSPVPPASSAPATIRAAVGSPFRHSPNASICSPTSSGRTAHGQRSHIGFSRSWPPRAGASRPSWTSSRPGPEALTRIRPPGSPGAPPRRPTWLTPPRNSPGCWGNSPTRTPGRCPPSAVSSSTRLIASAASRTLTPKAAGTSWS
ncbi:hypothetical protein NKH18_48025 [Streptomyces sp. M10(2022)]